MKKQYEITKETCAIIGLGKNKSLIIEGDEEFMVDISSSKIIDDSCRYFGSSYIGRFEGTKNLIGINYKSPIIIEESRNIIFFPTVSPRMDDCSWISLNNLINYENVNNKTNIIFNNGHNLELDISYNIMENQILRAMRLDSVLQKRKIGN